MKKTNRQQFVKDVETLVEKTIPAEVESRVWDQFEFAMSKLDEASLELLKQHFNGATVPELSRLKGVTEPEIQAWLSQAKRSLIQNLRSRFQVRQ